MTVVPHPAFSQKGQAPDPPAGGVRGSLLPEARRGKILEWLREEGSARVRDLSDAFGVSEATVRQDLEKLEGEGVLSRKHGGAFLTTLTEQVRSLSLQQSSEAKRRIGKAAAALVKDSETIILDAGSTITEMAEQLMDRQYLTVITSSINIALSLGANPTLSVHLPGGLFKPPTLSVSGEKSADYFKSIYAEKVFLATAGISFEAGLTYPSLADHYVKRAMIASGVKIFLLADSSKIGRTSFSSLGPITMVDTIITDPGIKPDDHRRFEDAGIEVIIA